MAFGSMNDDDKEMSDINVTPLVDVMLVLLIVFMITMPVLTQSIPLELPTASIEKQDEPKAMMRIAINSEGTFIDKNVQSDDELKTAFEAQFSKNKDTVIAISADKEVPYEKVVKVLELAQNAGLKKVGFVTEQVAK
ncbi:Biopolymer transport protein exbD [Phocoenobacter uteri]|uniref:Biopolymer transport protein exbD n=1 Tax=Phocoenobacter uteri TaxID=146806 RepID=A0A379CCU2_9PAST|nr:biopolymer transporter ExbD [Phocoenobacter uteri]MDG6881906.1 biopolymer transporter ExbD [Phocoenobacter uteri]SUB59944.1 Biopolymer transport protein exbD [Phocoenobacter uteri]